MNEDAQGRDGRERLAAERLTEALRLVERAAVYWRSGDRTAALKTLGEVSVAAQAAAAAIHSLGEVDRAADVGAERVGQGGQGVAAGAPGQWLG